MPNTRDRSGSIQIDDVKALLQQLEDRLTSQITRVFQEVESLEKSIEAIQANQIRLDNEMSEIKKVVVTQQKQIEKFEAEKREKNVLSFMEFRKMWYLWMVMTWRLMLKKLSIC